MSTQLTTDRDERKGMPLFRGVLKYFPDALCAVAQCSDAGNRQHHPDKPLHWDKSKSSDEGDALMRHLLESGTVDTDGIRHSAKVAWRALALLQREIDAEKDAATKPPIVLDADVKELLKCEREGLRLTREEQLKLIEAGA